MDTNTTKGWYNLGGTNLSIEHTSTGTPLIKLEYIFNSSKKGEWADAEKKGIFNLSEYNAFKIHAKSDVKGIRVSVNFLDQDNDELYNYTSTGDNDHV